MKIDPSKVNLNEADIEEWLWQNPTAFRYNDEYMDAHVVRWLARQYDIPSGRLDLLGQFDSGELALLEIKNVEIDAKAIAQVCRYTFDIRRILRDNHHYLGWGSVWSFLVGPSISGQAYRECEAVGVHFFEFSVQLSLTVKRSGWTAEFEEKRDAHYQKLGGERFWQVAESFARDAVESDLESDEDDSPDDDENQVPDGDYSDVILE